MLYIRKMLWSSLLGLAFAVFAPYGAFKILGLMWLFFPVTAYITGRETEDLSERRLAENQEKKLREYISDMWKFYNATVTKRDNYLPPDNIQFFPVESTAHRTSPTNIGLYMLSVLSARDFDLIDSNALCSKLEGTVSAVEKMEKRDGHLYNWYDTKNLKVIGSRFISTVDSGNFAACLTALKEGLREYRKDNPDNIDNLIARIEKILAGMDFSALYNASRDLFYIGYDEDSDSYGENCYDLYMSEAKITSYFAIARGEAPKKHWQKLGRTLIKENGYMGLASWTGTAFEYFMPNLLLPLSKNSLTYEAHRFALREQAKRRGKYNGTEVWGISESGFYAFDFDMNYQYQAFGVQKLGLKRGLNKELVISPYSSFLALSISPRYAMNNLARLEKLGMYGKYGFYEACDFTRSRSGRGMCIVKSYMAHHLGMSIIAAANTLKDNIFQKRFMRDAPQRSAAELLQEKIPVDAVIFEDINPREVPEKINRSYGLIEKNTGKINLENPVCRLISNSKSKITASSSGDIMLSDGVYNINYSDFDRYNNLKPFSVMFKYGEEVFSQSKTPINRENAGYSYEFTDSYAHYRVKEIIDSTHITGEASYSLISDSSCFVIETVVNILDTGKSNNNKNRAQPEIMLYFEPIIAKAADFAAHPAFSSLFIEAEYDEKNKTLFYKRRPMRENEPEKWLALEAGYFDAKTNKTESLDFTFETRRDDILPHLYDESDIAGLFDRDFGNICGACINPVCAVKLAPHKSRKNKNRYEALYFIAFADKKEDAVNILKSAKRRNIQKENQKITESSQNRMLVSGITPKEKNLLDIILSCIHCKTLNNKPNKEHVSGLYSSVKSLWKEGISGDLPIVLLVINDVKQAEIFEEYLRVYKYLNSAGQKYDFAVIFSEPEKYGRPCGNKIAGIIKKNGCGHYIKKRGGIFILDRENLGHDRLRLLYARAAYKYETNSCNSVVMPPRELITGKLPEIITKQNKNNNLNKFENFRFEEPVCEVNGGYFAGEDIFYIDNTDKRAPWSHIITNKQFGTLITHKSLGFTWYSNARERRLTAWENDPVSDMKSERLILSLNGEKYDLCALSSYLKISPNTGEYYGKIKNIEYKISVTADEKLFIKLITAEFYPSKAAVQNETGTETETEIEISYLIKPVMGVAAHKFNFLDINDERGDTITFRNVCNIDFHGWTGFVRAIGGKIKSHDMAEFLTDAKINACENDYIAVSKNINLNLSEQNKNRAVFALGCYKSRKYFDYVYKKLGECEFTETMTERSKKFILKYMPGIKLKIRDDSAESRAVEFMFNTFLPYQNITGRIFGRTGFYQSSGAFGYRDQLQDMSALVYAAPELVKAHIYRAAAHQFTEGDVQHWWHNIKTPDSKAHRGVRTKCSDDYLWLAYVTAFYIEKTGDINILDAKIEYLKDIPLGKDEKERYSEPEKSGIRESVYEHCIKSIEYGLKFGEHNLPLMGSGDWNDGMTLVGAEGKGESVWLAQFLIIVLDSFIPVCERMGETETAARYREEIKKIRSAIETHCFEGDRYIRGFYDNGVKLGSKDGDECKIDILPQAFAAITAGIFEDSELKDEYLGRIEVSLNTAYRNLFDEEYKILKLFTPPFYNGAQNPGYIKGYVAGIRENGGQYTHAAVWGALGFLTYAKLASAHNSGIGSGSEEFYKKGLEIIKALNPAIRCSDKKLADIYRIEPYVLSGDIYSNESHTGRGGWSWYTGSSAWYYRVILEEILGVKLADGKYFTEQNFDKFPGFENIEIKIENSCLQE
ncbi:MAG: hypothetical protein FWH10_07385 [Oscillospiraceae bacterium]|nr:hypothetical protein [Oscillospiraceae bacterium]